jgi:hypothetical protein
MPHLSLIETSAIADLSSVLYNFLPGSGAPYTWKHVAAENGVGPYWREGISKGPAITSLLESTLEFQRAHFCGVVVSAVRGGLRYRLAKKTPLTREEIDETNSILLRLSFKIPELHEPEFLSRLTRSTPNPPAPSKVAEKAVSTPIGPNIKKYRERFMALVSERDSQKRGYQFEQFLNEFFADHELAPRSSFRTTGEQIDGTFELNGDTYVVEARWRTLPANAADLYVLRAKAEKSEWTRGLFISIGDFTDVASTAFRGGRRANLITLSGQDLMLILDERWTFLDALRCKLRHAGETGDVYCPLANI